MTTTHTPGRTRPRRHSARVALAAALLLVAACGSDQKTTATPATTASASVATTGSTVAATTGSTVAATTAAATAPSTAASATVGSATTPPTGTAASGAAASPGVTADSITISISAGFSGAYGDLFKAWATDGFGLWADEVNAGGGINGRKVKLTMVNNFDTAEGGVAACKDVQSNGSFMAVIMAGFGGADASMADCLDKAAIPVAAINLSTFDPKSTSVLSIYDSGKQAAPLAGFIKTQMGDPDPKVGLIVTDDPIHLGGRDKLLPELTKLGIKVVDQEVVTAGQGSFVAELTRLKSAGATTVAMITATESIGIVRDAASIGYAPKWTGLYWTIDDLSQAAAPLWTGIEGIRGFPTADSKAYAAYTQKAAQFGHKTLVNTTVMAFYGNGLVVGDILKAVGPNLTRQAVPGAAESLGDYDNGIWHLTFGKGIRNPDVAMYPVKCCSAEKNWTGAGDAKVTFT